MDPSTPTPLRINTSKRQAFDSYFPLEDEDQNLDDSEARLYDSDLASLPFPAPLTSLRASFRGDDFECDKFLVQNQKHGQLDDLLIELRDLSKLLENELVKGVEGDYEAFIGLGRLDSRKVDELRRSVSGVIESIKKIEVEVQANLDDVEATLTIKKEIREKKNAARNALRISRGVDELAYLLDDEVDLDLAVEAYEQVQTMTKSTSIPDFEFERYVDLQTRLKNKLQDLVTSSKHETRLDSVGLMRRFIEFA